MYDRKNDLEARQKIEELSKDEIEELARVDNNILRYNKESINLRNKLAEVRPLKEVLKDPDLSIKDKLSILFKRKGLTVISIAAAIGLVITSIAVALGLRSGPVTGGGSGDGPVKKGIKKVSDILKWLGNKAAAALPGIIGSVVSLVLRTAGQVVGFIAEHVWILASVLAVYLFEKMKK